MPGNSAGAVDRESMVSEEREHVGNLLVNVFPISAGEDRGWQGGGTILHVLTKKTSNSKDKA